MWYGIARSQTKSARKSENQISLRVKRQCLRIYSRQGTNRHRTETCTLCPDTQQYCPPSCRSPGGNERFMCHDVSARAPRRAHSINPIFPARWVRHSVDNRCHRGVLPNHGPLLRNSELKISAVPFPTSSGSASPWLRSEL